VDLTLLSYRLARRVGLPLWHVSEKNALHASGPAADGAYVHLASGKWQRVRHVSRVRRGDGWADTWRQECVAPPPLRFGRGLVLAPLMAGTDLAPVTAGTNDNWIYASNAVYLTARNATSGTLGSVSDAVWYVGQAINAGPVYQVYRAMAPFDATGLPDTCDIDTAHVHPYATVVYAPGQTVHQVSFTGSNPMATGDFDLFGIISRGSGVITPANPAGVITLTDFSDISRTVASLLGFKTTEDINATAPTGAYEFVGIASADNGTPSYRPVLHVSYTTISYVYKVVTETLNVTEAASRNIGQMLYKVVTETLRITEVALQSGPPILRIITEALGITELLRRRRSKPSPFTVEAKGSTAWTKETKPTTVWAKEPKPTTVWTKEPKPATTWTKETKGSTPWKPGT